MLLEGSCHCGAVRFRVESETPYPYQACMGGPRRALNLNAVPFKPSCIGRSASQPFVLAELLTR